MTVWIDPKNEIKERLFDSHQTLITKQSCWSLVFQGKVKMAPLDLYNWYFTIYVLLLPAANLDWCLLALTFNIKDKI